ncbi:MAG: carbamoyltransferase HypF [Candidatus Omnitrophica bacterium]|nr:carbamoyltransferase HypF [Candidatus Omnitrophota bacterium]
MRYVKIGLPFKKRSEVLALGAQSKASFCLLKNGVAYLSGPCGDLGDLRNIELFEKGVASLRRGRKSRPGIIACDLHPEYISTRLAKDMTEKGARLKPVQHHEAHVASCMADNAVKGAVIGIAFDGTGFGRDGNIWGGEFFTGSIKGFKRAAHLKYIPMPGGEASIKKPWHMAWSYLYNIYGMRFKGLKIDFLRRPDKAKIDLLTQIIDKKINSPLTSSMGRLFDAVSSLLGICYAAEYEGQAAIELEKAIKCQVSGVRCQGRYNFKYKDEKDAIVIDWAPVIRGIVKDLQAKKDRGNISLKFHNTICAMIKDVCILLRKKYKISKVCLSGGVFQNRYLTSRTRPLLEEEGFRVYLHKKVPAHDGNIALGQAVLAGT